MIQCTAQHDTFFVLYTTCSSCWLLLTCHTLQTEEIHLRDEYTVLRQRSSLTHLAHQRLGDITSAFLAVILVVCGAGMAGVYQGSSDDNNLAEDYSKLKKIFQFIKLA